MKANILAIQLSAVTTAAAVATTLLPLSGGAAAALVMGRSKLAVGNFTQSCTDVILAGYNLNATCTTVAGAESQGNSGGGNGNGNGSSNGTPADRQNMLNLPLCVGVDYTTMHMIFAYYGKVDEYCHNCTLAAPAQLSCTCKSVAGDVVANSTLNLDNGVGNENGVLKCLYGQSAIAA